MLFGCGGGSEWALQYDGGKFTVQFAAVRALPSFLPSFPAIVLDVLPASLPPARRQPEVGNGT